MNAELQKQFHKSMTKYFKNTTKYFDYVTQSTDATPSTSHKVRSAATSEAGTTETIRGHHVTETTQGKQEDILMSSSSLSDLENLPEVPFNV